MLGQNPIINMEEHVPAVEAQILELLNQKKQISKSEIAHSLHLSG